MLYFDLFQQAAEEESGVSGEAHEIANLLKQARVYVVSEDATRVVFEAANTMLLHPFSLIALPASPVWIEFEIPVTAGQYRLGGIIAMRHEQLVPAARLDVFTASVFYSEATQVLPSVLFYTSGTQSNQPFWKFLFAKPCQSECSCPLRPLQLRGFTATETQEWHTVCACASEAREFLAVFMTVFHLLDARGIVHEERVAPPQRPHKHTYGTRKPQGTRFHHISLSKPEVVTHYTERDDGEVLLTDRGQWPTREVLHTDVRRLLIPGPGKPWKKAAVVLVRPHVQRYHVKNMTRWYVEE